MNGDCISYSIYLPGIHYANSTEKCDYLEAKISEIYAFLSKQTSFPNYIWNYEKFKLSVTHPKLFELKGNTQVKDNIEDEWYITFLLYELSRNFTDFIIQLTDRDGDFLLIEAANYLPHWLQPNTSLNRVFIHSSKLHIIPLPQTPGDIIHLPIGEIPLADALQLIWGGKVSTICNDKIQHCVDVRLKRARDESQVSHFAICQLPYRAAKVLTVQPDLIPHAIHALSERDPNELQDLKFNVFSLENGIAIRIRFSRFLFAKLKHIRFTLPTNGEWSIAPPTSDPGHQPYLLGAKLTTGLELLVSRKCGYSYPYLDVPGTKGNLVDNSGGSSKNADDYLLAFIQNILENSNLSELDILELSNRQPPPSDEEWLKMSENDLNGLLYQADMLPQPDYELSGSLFDLPENSEEFANLQLPQNYVSGNEEFWGIDKHSNNGSTEEEVNDNDLKYTDIPNSITEGCGELDLDINLVTSTLLSYAEQNGQVDSVLNILESLGLKPCEKL